MTIEIEATLRENNELTIPPEIAERHNLLPRQKLLIVDRMERAGEFIVRVISATLRRRIFRRHRDDCGRERRLRSARDRCLVLSGFAGKHAL